MTCRRRVLPLFSLRGVPPPRVAVADAPDLERIGSLLSHRYRHGTTPTCFITSHSGRTDFSLSGRRAVSRDGRTSARARTRKNRRQDPPREVMKPLLVLISTAPAGR